MSFQGRSSSASSFHASLLQAINGVMSLAWCLQVVSQASQHFRSSQKQATCQGCFALQSICSVVSSHSGISRANPQPQQHINSFPALSYAEILNDCVVKPSKEPAKGDTSPPAAYASGHQQQKRRKQQETWQHRHVNHHVRQCSLMTISPFSPSLFKQFQRLSH